MSSRSHSEHEKIVLDTNIWISALLWKDGEANKLLKQIIKNDIPIATSEDIIKEFTETIRKHFPNTSHVKGEQIIRNSAKLYKPTKIAGIVNDPDDDHIIGCAIAAKATYIITYDKEILHLENHNGIKILHPTNYLREREGI